MHLGWNQVTPGSGRNGVSEGIFNTTDGNVTGNVGDLNLGRTADRGTANGEFIVGNGVAIEINVMNIGIGSGSTGTLTFVDNFVGAFDVTTVNFARGLFDFGNNTLNVGGSANIQSTTFNFRGGVLTGDTVDLDPSTGTFNFTGGRLAVNEFNGTLDQNGGTLAPGNSADTTTINGDYNLVSVGTYEVEIFGVNAGSEYDQLDVNGGVDLNADGGAGGVLDVILEFAPSPENAFLIVDNDGADVTLGRSTRRLAITSTRSLLITKVVTVTTWS